MSGFYQINVAVSRPMGFNLEQNLHTSKKLCRIKFQLQSTSTFTGWEYLCRIFSFSSRKKKPVTLPLFSLIRRINQTTLLPKWFFQNDSSFSLLLFQNNVRKYVFVLPIDRMMFSMFCTWSLTLWKTSSPRNPLPLGNYCPLTPPAPRNFQWSSVGGGGGYGYFLEPHN